LAEWANYALLVYLGTLIVLVLGGSFYAWMECPKTVEKEIVYNESVLPIPHLGLPVDAVISGSLTGRSGDDLHGHTTSEGSLVGNH